MTSQARGRGLCEIIAPVISTAVAAIGAELAVAVRAFPANGRALSGVTCRSIRSGG